MIDWIMVGFYTVMLLLGVLELYQTYGFHKWDKKTKTLPTAPIVTFYGGYIGIVLVLLSLVFMTGTTDIKLGHAFYIIVGICLMIVSIVVFRRGHQISKSLKENESNLRVVQTYLIAFVIFFAGFLNLFK